MEFLQSFLQDVGQVISPKILDYLRTIYFPEEGEGSKKQTTPAVAIIKERKKVHFAETVPLLIKRDEKELGKDKFAGENTKKPGIQVKILMTKEEAARLLSKCKDGGVLEFRDVAMELTQIPNDRVRVVSK